MLGHEVAGDVVEVGQNVKDFKHGDRVVVSHHVPCNKCEYCKKNLHTACDTLRNTNFDPGGFSEFIRIHLLMFKLEHFIFQKTFLMMREFL